MKRFKGTPSPWEYNGGSGGIVVDSNGGMVASVYPMHYENTEKMKANAHLIATAPDLLEALFNLTDELELYFDDGGEHPKTLIQARQVIAKALGEVK